jgi:exodeoxyribonuclease V beta subunit
VADGLELHRHAVIEASAGTGKTYTLEQLVLRLLREEGATLDQILLVTYTEKATGELKARLRRCLEEGRELQAAVDAFDQANIYTIHGFCQRVLQEYAFENRQDFHPQLVHDRELLESCLRELQRRHWREEFGPRLSLVLELAGYATPRGGPEWEKLVQDLALNYRPGCEHELRPAAGTDWLAALDRLAENVRKHLPMLRRWAGPIDPRRIETHRWYLGFGQLNFRQDYREARRTRILLPLLRWLADPAAETQPVPAFRRLLAECAGDSFDRAGFTVLTDLPSKAAAELPVLCPQLSETVDALEKLRDDCESLMLREKLIVATVKQLQEQLAATKREHGLQSFEDLLTRVDDALDPNKNRRAAALTAALRDRFRFAIVDEFQDTDPIQWRIFKKIFVDSQDGHRLFVVGDPKQAIFGFRGADVETFFQARDHLTGPCNAQTHSLDVNWRSCPELLDALNRLFGKGGWFAGTSIQYRDVQAAPEAERRNVIIHDASNRAALTLVDLTHCSRLLAARDDMARFIVAEIGRLLDGGPDGATAMRIKVKDRQRWLGASDICILVSKRREAGPVIEGLRQAKIPFTFYKQPGLWASTEAVHLEYVLNALARPEQVQGFHKALLTRFYRIRPEELACCEDLPHNHAVRELFAKWRECVEHRRWAELFQSLLEDTGVLFVDPDAADAERSLANYRHIFLTLQQAAYARDLDLFGLLEVLREMRRRPGDDETDLQPIETDQPKVKILTIHAAKGLEFPVVFLAGGFTLGLPSPWTTYRDPVKRNVIFDLSPDREGAKLAAQERTFEDRRLLYVALTRAMFKLYVPMLGVDQTYTKGGPIVSILAPAIAKAKLDGEQSEIVETAKVGLVVKPPAALHGATAQAEPETTPQAALQVAELFPQLDPDLYQRRIAIRSFSSLHRGAMAAAEGPVYFDRLPRTDDDPSDALEEQAVLRGPVFGEMVHAVLEKLDFASVLHAADFAALLQPATPTRELIDEQLALHLAEFPARAGEEELADACRQLIARLVYNTLRTPLKALGGPLAAIATHDRLHELEFDFPELEKPPPGLRRQEGFLTGIIDLVIRRGDRFFLVDWKTNSLPGSYAPAELRQSMQECDYYRQYRLYAQALARWLTRVRGRAIHPARDFGGVYYLYLRGMNGQDEKTGVFFAPVTKDDLRLERVLGE